MYLIHCEHSRLCWVRTLSSSSVGHLSCFIIRLSHRCRHCRHRHRPRDICPVEASSPLSSGRGLVIRPPHHHHRRYLVGLIVCPPHCRHRPRATCPAKASLPSLSGGGSRRLSPTVVVVIVGHPPHHRHHPWATCPAKASSPSLSGGGYVVCPPPLSLLSSSATPHIIVVIVVCGPFVLQRLCRRHHPVGASSSVPHIVIVVGDHLPPPMSLLLSFTGHLSCGGLVAIIVWWGCLLVNPC